MCHQELQSCIELFPLSYSNKFTKYDSFGSPRSSGVSQNEYSVIMCDGPMRGIGPARGDGPINSPRSDKIYDDLYDIIKLHDNQNNKISMKHLNLIDIITLDGKDNHVLESIALGYRDDPKCVLYEFNFELRKENHNSIPIKIHEMESICLDYNINIEEWYIIEDSDKWIYQGISTRSTTKIAFLQNLCEVDAFASTSTLIDLMTTLYYEIYLIQGFIQKRYLNTQARGKLYEVKKFHIFN